MKFREKFGVNVGVHQGSVLSPLLFVVEMAALSQDCRRGCPWKLLYADELVLMDESLDGLLNQFTAWKDSFDAKGLRVNMSKTKILVSNALSERPVDPTKYKCGVCKEGVGKTQYFVTIVKVGSIIVVQTEKVA